MRLTRNSAEVCRIIYIMSLTGYAKEDRKVKNISTSTISTLKPEVRKYRKPSIPVHPLFLNRWSCRAFSGEKISKRELMSLFEAARWAPSSFNNQHWRFLFAMRESKEWGVFFGLLGEFNQQWCRNAAALVVIVSKKTFDYNKKPAVTHSFDTGAAWENIALQASINGLVAHGMEGFDYNKARKNLCVPADHQVEAMVAIGKPGRKEDLPPEMRQKEFPSSRKKISEIVCEGVFRF